MGSSGAWPNGLYRLLLGPGGTYCNLLPGLPALPGEKLLGTNSSGFDLLFKSSPWLKGCANPTVNRSSPSASMQVHRAHVAYPSISFVRYGSSDYLYDTEQGFGRDLYL